MSLQTQVDALEHLLIAVLKKNQMTLPTDVIFNAACASVRGSNGPTSTVSKEDICKYLDQMKSQI